jgi:hypothetical protein
MVTGIRSVLFQESLNSFRRVQALDTIAGCFDLWLDDNLTFHPLVPKTTGMAALE